MLQQLLEPTPLPPSIKANRIPSGSDTYNEVLDFLYDEAEMLDNLRLGEWAELLTKDLEYNAPLRHTRSTSQFDQTYSRNVQHLHENYGSMLMRVKRITDTKSAWGEDPPSRIKRLVTNVRVYRIDDSDDLKVESYLLLTRSRFDFDYFDLIPCVRHDILRREDGALKLARREILLDQVVIGTPNLGVIL
ncbi:MULTISPECIES: aromatic-ring-hydroxylating dioxygenase subunit beta [Rhodocyclales]|jgi:3-phenylpropionate/cinnamic acid dioxygenase small subunit|uniref:Aromatic-ring-hydroxylating dioxygenase subunit beta n=1 Tax=Aromatoleum petrolei TaxID=76116 RepID=A0ABX1MKY5_9RHOO|nr:MULTISPECIES: aromatic-ring-hydroxylating dioxygenase subunit beta [Rhodocyclales]KAI5913319.1 aromatic-ring-hydroxylating dioxygenase subunit beta [Thauera sp. 2A1]MDX9887224.1 aromatic-ring-hydroxylating dioxygenase subunit beta [Thauera sp.]NMF87030.1 aromatic-ring-hydroxylating dioxygenase subunit beta [Aromatoleum petrolei]QTQ34767.1 Aromatic ring-hydroxylating dioxygenase, beta subunit [Aromatoleum petrolei]